MAIETRLCINESPLSKIVYVYYKKTLTPRETALFQIIKNPRNSPDLTEEERFEFVKAEFLKPENAGLLNMSGDMLSEFVLKGYIAMVGDRTFEVGSSFGSIFFSGSLGRQVEFD